MNNTTQSNEGNKNEQAWDYALGLIKIDGLTPSKEFLELVEKEKNGDITTDDMLKVLNKKYKMALFVKICIIV